MHTTRAFALRELIAGIFCTTLLLTAVLPVLARGRAIALSELSLGNLTDLGVAHAMYAFDWNARQVSVIDDDIALYGSNPAQAFSNFADITGADHPPFVLGWGDFDGSAVLFAYRQSPGMVGNHGLVQPLVFSGSLRYFGSFRLPNPRPFHDYLGGRFYDPVFYAPSDEIVYPIVEPAFDDPAEYVNDLPGISPGLGGIPAWASYCWSPAAFFNPQVLAPEPEGGFVSPWELLDGFTSRGFFQATYPSLKTQMLEHHWLQNTPAYPCNPSFSPGTYSGCEPYYFNHGFASAPATLFYDLSTRLLPNTEVVAADAQVMKETGYGLWSRDTNFGEDGYLSDSAYDTIGVSHHVLTTGGITGRDTVDGPRSRAFPASTSSALKP